MPPKAAAAGKKNEKKPASKGGDFGKQTCQSRGGEQGKETLNQNNLGKR